MLSHPFLALSLFALATACYAADGTTSKAADSAALFALIALADKIVVSDGVQKDAKILYTSTDAKDITEFGYASAAEPPEDRGPCTCSPLGPAVHLYRGDTELVVVTCHFASQLGCSLWQNHSFAKNPARWLRWFDSRHIAGPRQQSDGIAATFKQIETLAAKWRAGMPQSARRVWNVVTADYRTLNLPPLRTGLAKEFPDPRERALALFSWFGCGEGPWSGGRHYETAAEEMLLDISSDDLIAAAQTESLTESQLEGAARFFGTTDFTQRVRRQPPILPASLKRKLLEHSLKSGDKQKIECAMSVFGR